MSKIIGIDFGTGSLTAAVVKNGIPMCVRNTLGKTAFFPGDVGTGGAAWGTKGKPSTYLSAVSSIKREAVIGGKYPWLEGKVYYPVTLLTNMFSELKALGESFSGKTTSQVVICLPERLQGKQTEVVNEAAVRAGFEQVQTVADGVAAMHYYASCNQNRENILICDGGAGTFSVTLGSIKGGEIEKLYGNTEMFFGGLDFDTKIADRLAKEFATEYGISLYGIKGAMPRLYTAAEEARICLSYKKEAEIYLPHLAAKRSQIFDLSRKIGQGEMYELTYGYRMLILNMLRAINISIPVQRVLLTGGLSYMPMVGDCIREVFDAVPLDVFHVKEAQAMGAALYGTTIASRKERVFSRHRNEVREKNNYNHKKKIFKVLVTATMSAGKSTFINALIGKKVSKAENMACTDRILSFANSGGKISRTFESEDGTSVNFLGKLAEFDLVIKDSPGVNSSMERTHRDITRREIKNGDYDLLVYIINASQIGVNDDSYHMEFVHEHAMGRPILFLLNKIDCLNPEEEDLKGIIRRVRSYISSKGFKAPMICPVSAKVGFEVLSDEGELELEDQLERRRCKRLFKTFGIPRYYAQEFSQYCTDSEIENLHTLSGINYVAMIIMELCKGGKI